MVTPLLLVVLAASDPTPLGGGEAARQICLGTRPVDRGGGSAEEREAYASRRRAILKEKRLAVVSISELEYGEPDESERKIVLLRKDELRTREGVHLFTSQRRFELDAV